MGWEKREGRKATYLQGVVVKLDVPHAGRGVEGLSGLRGVHEALLGGCVGADERGEVVRGEALALEQGDEVVGGVVHVREEALGRGSRGVLAAHVGAYPGALGARDGGVVVRVLREVGVANLELGLDLAEEQAHGLQPVVLRAVDLAEVHHEGAVGASRRRVLVPGARVVEAEADGGPGVVVALTVGFFEALGELGGDVPP